jgi:predicted metal-dependent phosphotriesterase family hydrolase
VRAIGPNSFFVGSDSGLVGTPNHTDALVLAAQVLRQNGVDERSLDAMFKSNPARLLGLPAQ